MSHLAVIPTGVGTVYAGSGGKPQAGVRPDAGADHERELQDCSVCWGFGAGDDGDPCPRCQGTGCA